MKTIVVLILILAVGYFAYQKFVGGSMSDEQKQVQALADEFADVKQQLAQAERSAGLSGMDATGDVNSAMGAAEALLARLQEAKEGLSEEKALQAAQELEAELKAFLDRKQ